MDGYKPFAELILGGAAQWFLFGPRKVPAFLAWGMLLGLGVALWIWMTPDASLQFAADWRKAVGGIVTFLAASKGFGSIGKAMGVAPATDSK